MKRLLITLLLLTGLCRAETTYLEIDSAVPSVTFSGGFEDNFTNVPFVVDFPGYDAAVSSDGSGQYIDLGVVPTTNTVVEIRCRWNWVSGENSMLAYSSADDGRYFISAISSSTIRFGYGNGFGDFNVGDISSFATYLISGGLLYRDGILIIDKSGNAFGSTISLSLLARNSNGSKTSFSSADVEYFRAWQSGTLILDMIPTANGGFYDRVNQKLYFNDGAGTLTTTYTESE